MHEFWTLLCERLETDLKGTEHAKMVEALFEGEQRDYVRCHECGTVSYRKDQFRDLKLVVPSAAEEKKLEAPTAYPFLGAGHTLSGATTTTAATATTTAGSTAPPSADADGPSAAGSPANVAVPAAAKTAAPVAAQRADVLSGLREMLQPEQMNGEEQYSCDCCGRKTDAERGVELTKLPKILTVQLKRFGFDFRTHARHKVNTPFAFDTTLDMSPFVAVAAEEQKQQQPKAEGATATPLRRQAQRRAALRAARRAVRRVAPQLALLPQRRRRQGRHRTRRAARQQARRRPPSPPRSLPRHLPCPRRPIPTWLST